MAFIDPWDGTYISQEKLQQLYEGAFGFGAKIQPEELDRRPIFLYFILALSNWRKNALIREEHNDMAYHYIKNLMITDAEKSLSYPVTVA